MTFSRKAFCRMTNETWQNGIEKNDIMVNKAQQNDITFYRLVQ